MDGELSHAADWIAFGPYVLIPSERVLKRDGQPLAIGDKTLDLLLALVETPGDILSKGDLAERVWRREWIEDGNLRVAIGALRKLLGVTRDGGDYIINVVGRGYCFCPTVPVDRWPSLANPARSRSAPVSAHPVGRPPSLLNPVFGRRRDIAQISDLLATRRFITIVGAGGIGKTTVAIACAALRADQDDDGVSFVDLAPIRDPALVPVRIAAALGVEPAGPGALESIIEHLTPRRRLLVLDNCEHLAEAVTTIVDEILAATARIAILATSREPLGGEGEAVYRLGPLALPDGDAVLGAEAALAYDAVKLFVDRVQANAPDFKLTDALAPVVVAICRKLDGVALAIRLAAGRVPAFGVRGIAGLLDDRFRLLSQSQRGGLARHQTLEATFDWSYELLTAPEKRLLARLAVFAATFPLDAARHVAAEPGDDDAVLATLGDLVDKSLVVFVEDEGGPRYRLLETVRVFALARLEASDPDHDTARRHARLVIARCETYQAELLGARDRNAAAIARATLDDARAALRWTMREADWPLAFDMIRAAGPLLTQFGFATEVGAWIERLLAVEPDPARRLSLHLSLGGALWLSAPEDVTTIKVYSQAYGLARELGDAQAQLRAAWSVVLTTCSARRPAVAIAAAEQLAIAPDDEPNHHAVLIRALAGVARHLLGDYATCEQNLRWLLEHHPAERRTAETGSYLYDPRLIGRPFLAWIEWFSGRLADAARTSELTMIDSGDHVPSIFNNTVRSAFPIAIESGRWQRAAQHLATLERQCAERPSWRAWTGALRDILAIHVDRSRGALDRLADFVTAGDPFNGFRRQTWYYVQLVRGYLVFGEVASAEPLLRDLIAFVEHEEGNWWRSELIALDAHLRVRLAPETAHARFKEALDAARAEGSWLIELRAALGARRAARTPMDRREATTWARAAFARLMAASPTAGERANQAMLRHEIRAGARLHRAIVEAPSFHSEFDASRRPRQALAD